MPRYLMEVKFPKFQEEISKTNKVRFEQHCE